MLDGTYVVNCGYICGIAHVLCVSVLTAFVLCNLMGKCSLG